MIILYIICFSIAILAIGYLAYQNIKLSALVESSKKHTTRKYKDIKEALSAIHEVLTELCGYNKANDELIGVYNVGEPVDDELQ